MRFSLIQVYKITIPKFINSEFPGDSFIIKLFGFLNSIVKIMPFWWPFRGRCTMSPPVEGVQGVNQNWSLLNECRESIKIGAGWKHLFDTLLLNTEMEIIFEFIDPDVNRVLYWPSVWIALGLSTCKTFLQFYYYAHFNICQHLKVFLPSCTLSLLQMLKIHLFQILFPNYSRLGCFTEVGFGHPDFPCWSFIIYLLFL